MQAPMALMMPPAMMLQLPQQPFFSMPMRMFGNAVPVSERRKQFLIDIYEESKANAEPGSKEFDLEAF